MEHMDSDLAAEFVHGGLDLDARAYWKTHLLSCRSCRELLKRERSWSGLLKLDEEPQMNTGGLDRLLERIEPLTDQHPLRQRLIRILPAVGLAVVFGCVLGLVFRVSTTPSAEQRIAAELKISTELQRRVVAQLDALEILEHDHWLADEYETVRWIEQLIISDTGE